MARTSRASAGQLSAPNLSVAITLAWPSSRSTTAPIAHPTAGNLGSDGAVLFASITASMIFA